MIAGEAIVAAGTVSGRAKPDHRSELTTQWVCGERLSAVETEGDWCRVRGPDGYESWAHRGGLLRCDAGEAGRWVEAATARSLGAGLEVVADANGPAGFAPPRLPWGSRVVPGEGIVALPGGIRARVAAGDVVTAAERASRFPPDGQAVATTALSWLGAPYLWGGRTMAGVDCSGFVQAVLGMHGCSMPRDSALQEQRGPPCAGPGAGLPELAAGDLLFYAPDGDVISHVALSLGGTGVVHASATRGCVSVEDLVADEPLARRLLETFAGATRPLADARSG
ncbi:MAG: C40 family peptidase [Gemmatimonadota bacterium]